MDIKQKSNRLEDKVAIITGAGNGIGRGIALMFARHGAKVYGCDIDSEGVNETMGLAAEENLDITIECPLDILSPIGVNELIDGCISHYGKIDILVNSAAFGVFKFIEELNFDDWRKTLEGELDIVFLAIKAAWPHMKKNGGSIINFASANAYHALEQSGALAHCAGKGGILAMTRQLAMEGGKYNIRANSISPALIETKATSEPLKNPQFVENVLEKSMIKRLGQPEDVAFLAVFLASDESSWITGADYKIDGGATAW